MLRFLFAFSAFNWKAEIDRHWVFCGNLFAYVAAQKMEISLRISSVNLNDSASSFFEQRLIQIGCNRWRVAVHRTIWITIKCTLQIWIFHYMFRFISKQYLKNFAFLIPRILDLFNRLFIYLSSLLFNVFYCYRMFVNKHSTYIGCVYLKG